MQPLKRHKNIPSRSVPGSTHAYLKIIRVSMFRTKAKNILKFHVFWNGLNQTAANLDDNTWTANVYSPRIFLVTLTKVQLLVLQDHPVVLPLSVAGLFDSSTPTTYQEMLHGQPSRFTKTAGKNTIRRLTAHIFIDSCIFLMQLNKTNYESLFVAVFY